MPVQVAFCVSECVGSEPRWDRNSFETSLRRYGTRALSHVLADVVEFGDVHAFASGEIDNHPDGSGEAYSAPPLVTNFHIALREVSVVVFDPCNERVVFVDSRIALHFDCGTRQYPHLIVLDEAGVSHTPGVGVQSCNLNNALHEELDRHFALWVALGSGEEVGVSEFFNHLFRKLFRVRI